MSRNDWRERETCSECGEYNINCTCHDDEEQADGHATTEEELQAERDALSPEDRAKVDAFPTYIAPTPDEWFAIADAIKSATGFDTRLEGGGAACPFIQIDLPDGRIVLFGDNAENWAGDVYEDQEAYEQGSINETYIWLDIPTSDHDAEKIGKAFKDAITDVCIVGNPAILGRCGEVDCICFDGTHDGEAKK